MEPSRTIHRPRPNPRASARLFCIPYAGGTVNIFRTWPLSLPRHVEFCAIELPGHGARMREPSIADCENLVKRLAIEMSAMTDLPFALYGHSMGALVAFELARELRRTGRKVPIYLIISGFGAPELSTRGPQTAHLPDDQFIEALRKLEGTPPEVLANRELMQLMLPILRTDFAIVEKYLWREEPPLQSGIVAFGGAHDSSVPREHLEA